MFDTKFLFATHMLCYVVFCAQNIENHHTNILDVESILFWRYFEDS